MTDLQSWKETFEACAAAGLRLPDGYAFDTRHIEMLCGFGLVFAEAALALCRWTAIDHLRRTGATVLITPHDCEISWQNSSGRMELFGGNIDTLDWALQAACRAKAGK